MMWKRIWLTLTVVAVLSLGAAGAASGADTTGTGADEVSTLSPLDDKGDADEKGGKSDKLTPELWADEQKADWNALIDAKVAGLAEKGITVETAEIAPGVRDIVWTDELKGALGDFDKGDVDEKDGKVEGK